MDRSSRAFVRVVGGREVETILDESDLELDITVATPGIRATLAADVGTVGGLLADVIEEEECVDAEYRQWRGREFTKILGDDPKIAEWKAKARAEGSDAFLEYKRAAAKLAADHEFLVRYLKALEINATGINAPDWQDRVVGKAARAARATSAGSEEEQDGAVETARERRDRERKARLRRVMKG